MAYHGADKGRCGVLSVKDADFFFDRFFKRETDDVFRFVFFRFFRRKKCDPETSLNKRKRGRGRRAAADNLRIETGLSARLKEKLRGNLGGMLEQERVVLKIGKADPILRGQRMIPAQNGHIGVFAEQE